MKKLLYFVLCLYSIVSLYGCATTKNGYVYNAPELLIKEGRKQSQKGRYGLAIGKFKEVLDNYPFSEQAIEAHILIADAYYSNGEYEDAAAYYTEFAVMHPSHENAPYALFRKGMSYFKEVLSIDRDQAYTKKALLAFNDLIETFPSSVYAAKAREMILFLRERLAANEFYVGRFYYRKGSYQGAIKRFTKILERYPESKIIDKVLYYTALSYIAVGERDLSIKMLKTLLKKYPKSSYSRKARAYLSKMNP